MPDRRTLIHAVAALALGSTFAWAAPKTRTIRVVARKFQFVPAEIRVRKGEAVTLQFSAPEVPMGVNFADFGTRADIVPGRVATLRLVPESVGRYTFVCDVFCGSGHEEMSGTLIVDA